MAQNYNHIVIVGAGPIGLLNAIALKKHHPGVAMTMLEKYPNYQRYHVVKMSPVELEKYVEGIGSDDALEALCRRIKKNHMIRTSELETILREKALALGIEIRTNYEVSNLERDVYQAFPEADLVIGADGTHSKVSEQAFGKKNQEKHPFDYVLQFRYEVQGGTKPLDLLTRMKFMQSYGVTCHEFVGDKDANGRTPITFQLIINQEQFNQLYPHATSKSPLQPFSETVQQGEHIDPKIMKIIKGYLGLKLRHYTGSERIDLENARLSVNEAPATRAKRVYRKDKNKTVLLVGDAALGLSFFKGLNAGIEATNKLMKVLSIESELERTRELEAYQAWFDKRLAPEKIAEVRNYSVYRVQVVMRIFRFLNRILGDDFFIFHKEAERSLDLYRGFLADKAQQPESTWSVYPHRAYPVSEVLNLKHDAVFRHLRAVRKFWVDQIKPYKSAFHFQRDVFYSIRAVFQVASGSLKFLFAPLLLLMGVVLDISIPQPNKTKKASLQETLYNFGYRIIESGARVLFGLFSLLQSVILPLRILVRGVITGYQGMPVIENNRSIVTLVEQSEKTDAVENLNALYIDLHRHYSKAQKRHQKTNVSPEQEKAAFNACRPSNPSSYAAYFKLFKPSVAENGIMCTSNMVPTKAL